MAYFHISTGLRGCYMPDSSHCVHVKTRRALKEHLETELGYATYGDDSEAASKRDIDHIAARAWRSRNEVYKLPYCLPISEGYGLFVSSATRAEYLEAQEFAGN